MQAMIDEDLVSGTYDAPNSASWNAARAKLLDVLGVEVSPPRARLDQLHPLETLPFRAPYADSPLVSSASTATVNPDGSKVCGHRYVAQNWLVDPRTGKLHRTWWSCRGCGEEVGRPC